MRVYTHPSLPDHVVLEVGANRRAHQYLLARLRDAVHYDGQQRGFVMRRETWKALRGSTEQAESLVTFAEQFEVPILGPPPTAPCRSVSTQTAHAPRTAEHATQTAAPAPAPAPASVETVGREPSPATLRSRSPPSPPPSSPTVPPDGTETEARSSVPSPRPLDSRLLTLPLAPVSEVTAMTPPRPRPAPAPSTVTQSILSGVTDFRFIHRSRVHKQSILQGVT